MDFHCEKKSTFAVHRMARDYFTVTDSHANLLILPTSCNHALDIYNVDSQLNYVNIATQILLANSHCLIRISSWLNE